MSEQENLEKEKKMRKELLSAISVLFLKLLGETVKDKLARSLIVGALAAFGYYYELPPTTVDVQPGSPTVVMPQ